jgi:hypothetical protein
VTPLTGADVNESVNKDIRHFFERRIAEFGECLDFEMLRVRRPNSPSQYEAFSYLRCLGGSQSPLEVEALKSWGEVMDFLHVQILGWLGI